MKQAIALNHEFVEFIPTQLKERTVYISIRFATVSHLCPCGCNNKVVTPLKPTDWMLIFDGKTVSLHPSLGNWAFACRSHYWVRNDSVQWAEEWSTEEIAAGKLDDRRAKEKYQDAGEFADLLPNKAHKQSGRKQKPLRQKIKDWWTK